MSVVVVGGNECMTRRYIDIGKAYGCKVKCYHKMKSGLKTLGSPDLIVLFTDTMSHKMLRTALSETKGSNTTIARSHSSSASAFKGILREHAG